jgi:predicted RNA-binding Zn-ribbon protein involved in translation (DUF1610 family)
METTETVVEVYCESCGKLLVVPIAYFKLGRKYRCGGCSK